MSKGTKIFAAVMATMMMTTAFVGCGKKEEAKQSLTVWSHLSTQEVDEVRKVAEAWGKDNNVDVKVVEDKAEMQAYTEAANSSKGPDLYFGIAHDNLGTFQKAGLLAEVPSGTIDSGKLTSQGVVDAVTIGGKQYAVPLAQEAIALFYNKDIVAEAPKTLEEVVNIGKEKGFKFNITDFYLTYNMLSANGGYVFKNNDGTLDPTDIGLNNEGAVKGYQFLQDLVIKDKLMPVDINDDIAKGEFKEKKTAFYISGPWAVKDIEDAGVNLGITAIPTLNGSTPKPFLGVQAAFVSSKSDKKDLSWKLMNYLTENTSDILLEKGNRLPVLKSAQDSQAFKDNKYMSIFAEAAKVAVPMPNIPEVQAMWTPAADNLKSLIKGDITPKDAADRTAAQMKEGIAQQK